MKKEDIIQEILNNQKRRLERVTIKELNRILVDSENEKISY